MTMGMKQQMAAGAFKARCLRILDEVQQQRKEIEITKRGKPVAKLVPVEAEPRQVFGRMKGRIQILGDLLGPLDARWDASRGILLKKTDDSR